MIEETAGLIPTKGLMKELSYVYNAMATGAEPTQHLTRPQDFGYTGDHIARELWAEAIRAYMANPDWLKTVAPNVAARIREKVNPIPS